jgi:hypothetical protein
MAAIECARAFPYVDFGTLPVWMQTVWLADARERQAGELKHVPCPVD